eukprot:NODE_644_length_5619_cov_0.132790.p6 type:complete len:114 gc:universal NODE_644_length_5619_cov_0.132790:2969-3310(+)
MISISTNGQISSKCCLSTLHLEWPTSFKVPTACLFKLDKVNKSKSTIRIRRTPLLASEWTQLLPTPPTPTTTTSAVSSGVISVNLLFLLKNSSISSRGKFCFSFLLTLSVRFK